MVVEPGEVGQAILTARTKALERFLAHGRGDQRCPDLTSAHRGTARTRGRELTGTGADGVDSDALFLDDLVRQRAGEADDGAFGRCVVEQLRVSMPNSGWPGGVGRVPEENRG